MDSVLANLPAEEARFNKYQKAQAKYAHCSKIIEFCKSSWPVAQDHQEILASERRGDMKQRLAALKR